MNKSGFIIVTNDSFLYGLQDKDGNVIVPCQYDRILDFDDDGYIRLLKGKIYGTINLEGKEVIPHSLGITHLGAPNEVNPKYLEYMGQRRQLSAAKNAKKEQNDAELSGETPAKWTDICLINEQGERVEKFATGDTITLQLTYQADTANAEEALIGLALYRADKALCYGTNTQREHLQPIVMKEKGVVRCKFAPMNLVAGTYWFDVALRRMDMFAYDYAAQAVRFAVYDPIDETGVTRLDHTWSFDDTAE